MDAEQTKKSALIAVAMMFITAGLGLIGTGAGAHDLWVVIGGIALIAVGVVFIIIRENMKVPYEELVAHIAEELLPIFKKEIEIEK